MKYYFNRSRATSSTSHKKRKKPTPKGLLDIDVLCKCVPTPPPSTGGASAVDPVFAPPRPPAPLTRDLLSVTISRRRARAGTNGPKKR
ncbi:hypothetical protein EVAR_35278_1 [Eumeta japonica]|uniref:Uncharacterized protein n=1 Tax=Eumeta variegata TaxID=151549 RepID=A0A4C1VEK8_EUMVA|nr:hypothetical protein EVAR_35278_1 [Eumeta japonica]